MTDDRVVKSKVIETAVQIMDMLLLTGQTVVRLKVNLDNPMLNMHNARDACDGLNSLLNYSISDNDGSKARNPNSYISVRDRVNMNFTISSLDSDHVYITMKNDTNAGRNRNAMNNPLTKPTEFFLKLFAVQAVEDLDATREPLLINIGIQIDGLQFELDWNNDKAIMNRHINPLNSGNRSNNVIQFLDLGFFNATGNTGNGRIGRNTAQYAGKGARSSKVEAAKPKKLPLWVKTDETVQHEGATRHVWHSKDDANVRAVRQLADAGDGTRKVQYNLLSSGRRRSQPASKK